MVHDNQKNGNNMKTKGIIKSLKNIINLSGKKKKKDSLKKILKKLRKREVMLKKKIEGASGGKEKNALEAKLKVIRAQRKKGIKALRKLSGKE